MKKFIKNNLKVFIAILITAIICISGTVYAAIKIQASEIEYNDTTVDQALNDLYTIVDKPINLSIRGGSFSTSKYTQSDLQFSGDLLNNYQYFKVTKISKSNDNNKCLLKGYSRDQSKWVDILENTEYNVGNVSGNNMFSALSVWSYSYQDNQFGTCSVSVTLYNK